MVIKERVHALFREVKPMNKHHGVITGNIRSRLFETQTNAAGMFLAEIGDLSADFGHVGADHKGRTDGGSGKAQVGTILRLA